MLTKLIVDLYVWLLEIALWVALILASVLGYHITVSIMNDAGVILTNEFAWKILGALVFPVIAFLLFAVFIGPVLVLLDVRNAARNIEARFERVEDFSRSVSVERREPSF
jgi:uncharacterized protein YacL